MNTTSTPITTQASTSTQDHFILTRTATKTEMLKCIDHAYELGNHAYEGVGSMVDTICDKRNAVEAFQATDEFSTAQVEKFSQAFSQILEIIHQNQE